MRSGGEKKKKEITLSFFPLLPLQNPFFFTLEPHNHKFFLLFLPPRKEGEIKKKKFFSEMILPQVHLRNVI